MECVYFVDSTFKMNGGREGTFSADPPMFVINMQSLGVPVSRDRWGCPASGDTSMHHAIDRDDHFQSF